MMSETRLYILLKHNKWKLSRQQYRTIKGQIQSGDILGAYKGLKKVMDKKEVIKNAI